MNLQQHVNKLKKTIQEAHVELKKLEEVVRCTKPKPQVGQVWQHEPTGDYFIVHCRERGGVTFKLCSLDNTGQFWVYADILGIFGEAEDEFKYIGMAEDVIQIKTNKGE